MSQLSTWEHVSEGFLIDIFSDYSGISFHRLPIAAWTLVLGNIFVVQVYKGRAMPAFDATLLALMGISAGTSLRLESRSRRAPSLER